MFSFPNISYADSKVLLSTGALFFNKTGNIVKKIRPHGLAQWS